MYNFKCNINILISLKSCFFYDLILILLVYIDFDLLNITLIFIFQQKKKNFIIKRKILETVWKYRNKMYNTFLSFNQSSLRNCSIFEV